MHFLTEQEESTSCSPICMDTHSPDEDSSIFTDIDASVVEAGRLVSTGAVELDAVVVDVDGMWDHDEARVVRYVAGGCSCRHGPKNTPCHKLFSATQYREMRDECRELSRDELDMVIMGQLCALTVRDGRTQRASDRVRSSTQFRFGGHRICIKTFCFLHNIGEGKFTSIKSSWLKNGLRPRQRQHTTPHNVTSLSDVQQVVRFILNYAEDNAILLPGRIPGYKRDDMQLLPSSVTKREVWELYHETAASREGSLAVCYSLFCRFWRQLTPQVVVAKPMSDLCWTCQKNSTLIMRAHNTPVEEKTEVNVINLPFTYIFCVYQQHFPYTIQALQRAEDHLTLVTQERSLYREALDESRRQTQAHFLLEGKFTPPPPHGMIAPASNNIMVHYSFDFAQQVHYPSNPLQPGPIYFNTSDGRHLWGLLRGYSSPSELRY